MPAPSPTRASYCGRFAPSPTGPLHFGSMVAAVASYLDARRAGGRWLVRMEDVDRPRTRPGADTAILRSLERYGLHWDGEVVYQSSRIPRYEEALRRLREFTFGCACSRREVDERRPYPGTCRGGVPFGRHARAWRLRVAPAPVAFDDTVQGRFAQDLERDVGDFILKRADGLFAYQLAVVVDDAEQSVTDVVRGADLLDSTPRQIYLQRLLGYPTPRYTHVPVAVNAAGQKLSKQTRAHPVSDDQASQVLVRVLQFLGQAPPEALAREDAGDVLRWGIEHWSVAQIPRTGAVAVTQE